VNEPEIRIMESTDLPAALALGASAGWNQTEADWQRLLALEPSGCFVASPGDELAGTVTTLRYGRSLAWIGMVLVDPRFRRRGIATALMDRAIAYLRERAVATIQLDATDAGRAVYATLGFVEEHAVTRCLGGAGIDVDRPGDPATKAMTAADLPAVIALDEECFGVDRSELLRSLWSAPRGGAWLQRDQEGVVQGFLFTRPGANAHYLGPWCASTPAIAGRLLHAAIGSIGRGQPFLVDLAAPCATATDLLAPLGFAPARSCTRMRLGPIPPRGRPERVFGISGFETG
jgi:GNAT superfamily N-acetyltransferase